MGRSSRGGAGTFSYAIDPRQSARRLAGFFIRKSTCEKIHKLKVLGGLQNSVNKDASDSIGDSSNQVRRSAFFADTLSAGF